MSKNSEDRETKPLPLFTYRLRSGFTHYRDGGTEKMESGELIDMSEVRFKGANLKDRFELVGAAKPIEIRTPVESEPEPPADVPVDVEPEPDVVSALTDVVDWSSSLDASWASVVKTIKGLDDVDYIRSLREAEMLGRERGSVLRAADDRIQQLSKR